MNKITAIFIISFILFTTIYPVQSTRGPHYIPSQSADIYVDWNTTYRGMGWYDATHVATITQAITNANNGDTIFIYNGSYDEQVTINKRVTIIGQKNSTDPTDYINDTVSINTDPGAGNACFDIQSHWVNISNIAFYCQRASSPCILAESHNHVNISDCLFTHLLQGTTGCGIKLDATGYVDIYNNIFYGSGCGIWFENMGFSHHCTIRNNSITTYHHADDNACGIKINEDNSYNTIDKNMIYNNSFAGVHIYGTWNTVTDNTIYGNGRNTMTDSGGVVLESLSHNNTIGTTSIQSQYSNIFNYNNRAVVIEKDSKDNNVSMNLFNNSNVSVAVVATVGVMSGGGEPNHVFRNDFMNANVRHLEVDPTASPSIYWNLTYPGFPLSHAIGNYFDDYAGEDEYHGVDQDITGSDGVGDTPYPAHIMSTQAYYPTIQSQGNISWGIVVLPAQDITSTSADLWGWYGWGSNDTASRAGFYYGKCNNCTQSNHDNNVSVATNIENTSFSKTVLLDEASCYCAKAWAKNSTGFHVSSNTEILFTKPNGAPLNLTITESNPTSVVLTWDNRSITRPSCATDFRQYTLIKYSASSFPINPSDGSLGYKGTAETCTISGLGADDQYFFSAWTYIVANCSGEETFHQNSSEYSTTTTWTQGGTYNISVRYENTSYGYVPLNRWGPHVFAVYYYGEEPWGEAYGQVDYITINTNGTGVTNITYDKGIIGDFTNISKGNFTISTNRTIKFMQIYWNDTVVNYPNRCFRTIIPSVGERNITFFIRTNLPVYGQGTGDMNGSIIMYDYSFVDETGLFRRPNQPLASIYTFDEFGNRLIIHEEFFDTAGTIHPWLVYEKTYFMGVSCTLLTIDRLGIAPSSNIQNPEVEITWEYNESYTFDDLIVLNTDWTNIGFYVNYQDTTHSTSSVTFTVYKQTGGDILYNTTYTGGSNKNFSCICNVANNYYYRITARLDSIDNEYDGVYVYTGIMMSEPNRTMFNQSDLDSIIENIFGLTPVYNPDNNAEVPWTYIIIFTLSFIFLLSLGKLNAFLGALGCGMVLSLSGMAIIGFEPLFANYSVWDGPILLVIGVFIVVIGIIGLIGGVDRGGGFY